MAATITPSTSTSTAAPSTQALDVVEVAQPTSAVDLATSAAALAQPAFDAVATAVAHLDAKLSYARLLAQSSLIPDQLIVRDGRVVDVERTVANVFLVGEYSQLLNIPWVVGLAEINVVKGKVGMSAKLMRTKVYEAGHDIKRLALDDDHCTVHIIRADGRSSEPWTFTMAEARAMNLVKDGSPWKSIPQVMLFERATSRAVRATCPEVTMGVAYTIEEVEAMTDGFEAPAPAAAPDPVWPTDYADDTPLPSDRPGVIKAAVLAYVGDDKALAAALWPMVEEDIPLTLGELRALVTELQEGGRDGEMVDDLSPMEGAHMENQEALAAAARDRVARDVQARHDEEVEGMPHDERRRAAAQRAQEAPRAERPTNQSSTRPAGAQRAREAVQAARERHAADELPDLSTESRQMRQAVLESIEGLGQAYVSLFEDEVKRAAQQTWSIDQAMVRLPAAWDPWIEKVEARVMAAYDRDYPVESPAEGTEQ